MIAKNIKLQTILFLFVFALLALFVNSNNLYIYNLFQSMIESMVERGHFYLDETVTHLFKYSVLDTFLYEGHKYSNKQYGVAFLGAIPYSLLYKLGFNYRNNYELCCYFVSLATSVLLTSLLSVLFFNVVFIILKKKSQSLFVTLLMVFGTIIFPYGTCIHHDVITAFILFLAFYILFFREKIKFAKKTDLIFIVGILLGLSTFFSMSALGVLFALILYSYKLEKSNFKGLIFGFLLGFMPNIAFNYLAFNQPFYCFKALLSNIFLANNNESFPINTTFTHRATTLQKFCSYFISSEESILVYTPILSLAMLGAFFIKDKYPIEKKLVLQSMLFQFVFLIFFVPFLGRSQYGSRYLIALIPFAMLGLTALFSKENNLLTSYKHTKLMMYSFAVVSIFISLVGGLIGTVNFESPNSFLANLSKIVSFTFPHYYYQHYIVVVLFFALFMFFTKYPYSLKKIQDKFVKQPFVFSAEQLILFLIVFIGFILRVVRLDSNPPCVCVDEAKFAYYAQTILETGKHITGEILPAFFRVYGFEMSNPAMYYLSAIFIKLFGMNVYGLRLTTCVLGTISIYLVYKVSNLYFNKSIGLLSALLLAVSSWHIQISRVAMEHVTFVPFFLWSFYLLSKSVICKERKYIIYSAIPFGLTFYTYSSAKLFIPLFLLAFLMLNFKYLKDCKQEIITGLLIVFFILIPMLKEYYFGGLQARFNVISISNEEYSLRPARERYELSNKGAIASDKNLLLLNIFAENYFKHMSSNFLLKKGDGILRHHCGGRGQLLWFTYYMMFAGLIYILVQRNKQLYIFVIWFLLFPVGASLTYDSLPHAGRCVYGLPVFEILASVGFWKLFYKVKSLYLSKKLFASFALCGLLIFTVLKGTSDVKSFIEDYFTRYPIRAGYWFDDFIVPIVDATKRLKEYDLIALPFYPSDVQILFLENISPSVYLKNRNVFRYVNQKDLVSVEGKKVLYIKYPGTVDEKDVLFNIYNNQGNIAYKATLVK